MRPKGEAETWLGRVGRPADGCNELAMTPGGGNNPATEGYQPLTCQPKAPPMNRAVRAAAEAGAFTFAFAALAVAMLSITFVGVRDGRVIATAAALGSLAGGTVFLCVLASAAHRFPGKSPVLGARRGAAIGVLAVVVVASAHAAFTFGSGGFLYSLLWQVVYACLLGGGPVAVVGAVFGCSIERRYFGMRGT